MIKRFFYSRKCRADGQHYRFLFVRVRESRLLPKLRWLFRILDYLIPKDEKLVGFFSSPDFSDNPKVFSDYLAEHHPEYKQYWFYREALCRPEARSVVSGKKYHWFSIRGYWHIMRCKYLVSSHSNPDFLSSHHVCLNLWHGMPIKTLGYTEGHMNDYGRKLFRRLSTQSHLFVTSDFFRSIMGNCFAAPFSRIHITGQPRTDVAFESGGNPFGDYAKVIGYAPTFKEKKMYGKRNIETEFKNMFYLDDYDEKDFFDMLEANNWLLLFKPHPFDEWFYRAYFKKHPIESANFRVIYDADLKRMKTYFYQLFSCIDVLISDFSSITLDYLITRKPAIYLNALGDDYSQTRGFMLPDNYEMMMPGPKVYSYTELKNAVTDALTCDSSKDERLKMLPLIHKYQDNKACERVYNVMASL